MCSKSSNPTLIPTGYVLAAMLKLLWPHSINAIDYLDDIFSDNCHVRTVIVLQAIHIFGKPGTGCN